MLRRTVLVAVSAAALVPFLGGAASASCLDDLRATNVQEGTYFDPKTEHWWGLSYVEVTGTANVEVHGDALASDSTTYANDWVRNTPIIADNVVDASAEFVNCVAG